MKLIRFLFFTLLSAALVWVLEVNPPLVPSLSQIPPLGKFMDPFHGFWQNAEPLQTESTFEDASVEGLEGNVSVLYDTLLVPHVFAQNDHDLYFMQGYLTAKHRLWQMEFQTHAAAGRISEIIASESTLRFDRTQRRKGLPFAAKNFLKNIEAIPEMKNIADAYTQGVNAYISSLTEYSQLPLEYKLLNYQPEPWSPYKSALLLKYMANDLAFGDYDLEYTNAIKSFGPEMFALLYPDMLPFQDPIVNGTTDWDFEPVKVNMPANALPEGANVYNNDLVEDPDPDNGSNNWAVSGSKTKNGNPILCSDPHLQLNLPSIWYVMQLSAPGMNVKGATLPGSPNVIIGFNDSIAWGVTNARRDVVDWYEISFKEDDKSKYQLDGEWVDTETVIEEIKIKGEPAFFDTVYYTQWGPVMYDDSFSPNASNNYRQTNADAAMQTTKGKKTTSDRRNFALRWIAHDASEELLTFYKLNRADNYNDYLEALTHFASPAQNFAFAASNGDIAMKIQGKFPVKWHQQGKFIMDGSRSDMAWQAFIPAEHNVYSYNPERGFISSANQHPVDSTYPYYVYAERYEYYRNRRVNRLLEGMSNITIEDMMKMQNDNYNLMAAESLDTLLTMLSTDDLSTEEQTMYNALEAWDYYNDADQIAPAYFEAFTSQLFPMIWDEMNDAPFPLISPNKTNTFHLIKTQPDLAFFDINSTPEIEDAPAVVLKAFQKAAESIEEWKAAYNDELTWAKYKSTDIVHLARLPAFSVNDVMNGGNRNIINATSHRHGPSWRMVVEVTPQGPNAFGVYPGGQSGNPGSPFYHNMVSQWEQGKYFPMPLLTLDAQNSAFIQIEYTSQP